MPVYFPVKAYRNGLLHKYEESGMWSLCGLLAVCGYYKAWNAMDVFYQLTCITFSTPAEGDVYIIQNLISVSIFFQMQLLNTSNS